MMQTSTPALASTDIDRAVELGSSFAGELGRAIRWHRWLIIGVALGAMLTAYAALQFMNDEYESSARLLVKLGRENVELPASVEKGGLVSMGVRKEDINSEIQMLTARSLIEGTVDTLGVQAFKLEPPPPRTLFQRIKAELRDVARWAKRQWKEFTITLNLRPRLSERDEAILLVQDALVVDREKDSDVISVQAKLPSPDLAQRLVDTLVKLYLDRRVEVRRDPRLTEFFDTQLKTAKTQLEALDDSKLKIRDARSISAMDEERVLVLRRLQALNDDIATRERELRLLGPMRSATPAAATPATRAPVAGSASGAASSPAAVAAAAAAASAASAVSSAPRLGSYPNFDQLRAKVTDLRIRRTELLQRYSEGSEPIVRVDREIAQVDGTLRQALQAQVAEQRANASVLERRLMELNLGERSLDQIERDRSVLAQTVLSYAKRREEARVAEAMDINRVSNIAVLNAAERPIKPVGPKKLLIVGLSLPFGLLVGLGLSLLLEYVNPTIRDERDLDGLPGIEVLGTLAVPR